jgi:hypothetical protein
LVGLVGLLALVLPASHRPEVLEHLVPVVVAITERKNLMPLFRRPDVPAP